MDKTTERRKEAEKTKTSKQKMPKQEALKQKESGMGSQKRMSTRKLVLLALFSAVALVFSYFESLIPIHFAVPGIKLGLANVVSIVVLYCMGFPEALLVSVVRIILSAILFGNISIMLYSLAGALMSLVMMWLVSKLHFFTATGISICGGVAHNMGQIVIAMLFIKNQNIMMYAPVLIVSGVITGIAVGIVASFLLKTAGRQL